MVQKMPPVEAHQAKSSYGPQVTADESVLPLEASLQAALLEQPVLQPEEPPLAMQQEPPLPAA